MTLKELPPAPPMPHRQNGRRVKRGLMVAVIGFLSVLLVALIAAIVWVVRTDSRINRLPGDELTSLATTVSDTRTILIVGSDSRENIGDLEGKFGAFDGARTDVIMLARIEPDAGIHLLSIPRDLLVDIPGRDPNRINAAFAFGGPDLLIDTLQRALDVEINHYVEVDFGGFAEIVDSVGGVTYRFPNPARDKKSGLDVDAGVHTLDGATALAYARSRTYEELVDNEWKVVGGSDIGRTRRQQRLMLALFDEVTGRTNPIDLTSFASTVADQLTVDGGLDLGTLIGLGRNVLDMESGNIQTATLPVEVARVDGRSVVVPIEPDAALVLEAFRTGGSYPR